VFKRGRIIQKRIEWVVTTFDNPFDIMNKDSKTMISLVERCYGKIFKGDKKIMITKIINKKIVGYAQESE
tara:strand:+ start:7263 stop:7472 length:210 start_codon:yes stop_codon:yes gene_type:complete